MCVRDGEDVVLWGGVWGYRWMQEVQRHYPLPDVHRRTSDKTGRTPSCRRKRATNSVAQSSPAQQARRSHLVLTVNNPSPPLGTFHPGARKLAQEKKRTRRANKKMQAGLMGFR